ncbi:MAG: hypothetical protein ACKV2U_25220 [Bryobacteraceae bacterium]
MKVLVLFVLSVALMAQSKSPRLATVTPDTGKADVEYAAAGENLGKDAVKELYLTNGKDDLKMQVMEQTNEAIKFKVPGNTKPGRYSLMILTADGKQFIEQPVKLTIE